MKRFLASQNLRKWSTAGLGLAMCVLGLVAIVQAQLLRAELEDRELVRAERDLAQLADGVESMVAEQVSGWLLEGADVNRLDRHEAAHRRRTAWFDAYYLWDTSGDEPRFEYPPQVTQEMSEVLAANPCVQGARILSQEAIDRDLERLYRYCRREAPEVLLLAAWRAAETLLLLDRPVDTLQALDRLRPVERYDVSRALTQGLSPRRVVLIRIQQIDALSAQGQEDDARAAAMALFDELETLGGPVHSDLGELVHDELLPRLGQLGARRNPRELVETIQRSRRRAEGWEEIRDKAAKRQAPPVEDGPRIAYDLYGSPPYLLAIAQVDVRKAAALQLDQPAILTELLRRAGSLREDLVVLDASNNVLFGTTEPGLAAEANFGGILGHLRLGISQTYISERVVSYRWRFAWQVVTVLVATLIGLLALLARVEADRRELELLDRQREFTARVTHELKTPLAGIRVMAENLELGFGDAETRLAFTKRIIGEADRLSGRIDDVLRLSRAHEPKQSGPIDLRNLLEQLVKTWRPRMEENGIDLYASLQPVGTFMGDEPMIRDTLNGLLDNALKYHRPDHPDPRVWVRLRHQGRQAVIDVEDNGLGVPANKRKVIFERFARVEGPGRGKSGGHGLGLAFAGETVRGHGGRIECAAGSEGGARFVVRLPLESRST